jgi:hypothetical protein
MNIDLIDEEAATLTQELAELTLLERSGHVSEWIKLGLRYSSSDNK